MALRAPDAANHARPLRWRRHVEPECGRIAGSDPAMLRRNAAQHRLQLVYCFTLFGTYASDRVIATNRASFPRYVGEGRDGGVVADRAPSLASPPSPPSPVAGGRSRLVIIVISCIKYEALH